MIPHQLHFLGKQSIISSHILFFLFSLLKKEKEQHSKTLDMRFRCKKRGKKKKKVRYSNTPGTAIYGKYLFRSHLSHVTLQIIIIPTVVFDQSLNQYNIMCF